jgi:hypothetical protein
MRWLGQIIFGCGLWAAYPTASASAARICVRRAENNGLMNIIPSRVIIRPVGQQGSDQQVSIAGGERKCVEARPGKWEIEARSKRPYDPAAKDDNECRSNTVGVEVIEGRTVVIAVSPRSHRSAYLCGWRVRTTAGSRITRRWSGRASPAAYRHDVGQTGAPMNLTVTDEHGVVVAGVDTASLLHPTSDGSVFAHVVGRFEPGPGFARIRSMLERFDKVYRTGDLERASAVHQEIDRLEMQATDSQGNRYHVFNVYLQQDALLFAISRGPAAP